MALLSRHACHLSACLSLLLLFVAVNLVFFFFFFNDTATTEIYTLSLHDALPIWLAELLDDHGDHARGGLLQQEVHIVRSEEHTSELQSHSDLVCRLLLEKKKKHTAKMCKRTHTRHLTTRQA